MTKELLTTFTWLIPAGPMLVFFLIVLFTNRNKTLSWLLAWERLASPSTHSPR